MYCFISFKQVIFILNKSLPRNEQKKNCVIKYLHKKGLLPNEILEDIIIVFGDNSPS